MQHLEFTGKGRDSIFILLASFLITFFTLGFGLPWATTLRQRWIAKNTIVDGKRMIFRGSGSALFGKWIVWWILTIITFGIFGLVVWARYQKWIIEHTALLD